MNKQTVQSSRSEKNGSLSLRRKLSGIKPHSCLSLIRKKMNIIWFIFILSLSFPVCAEVVDLHVFREKGFSFTIDNTWKIVTEQNDPQELFIAQWLADELLEKTGLDLRYSIVDMQNMPASNRILLGLPQYSSQLSDVMEIVSKLT
jgi:hypothetical protein